MAHFPKRMNPTKKILFSQRIGGARFGEGTGGYKFARIKQAKRQAIEKDPTKKLLDFGIGEPDGMPPQEAIEVLCQEATKPENQRYADLGGSRLKEAAARYLQKVYGVTVDPHLHILHSIGTKSALPILALALVDPGDLVLVTVPGYPVFGTHAEYCGGVLYPLFLTEENHFLPDLETIPEEILTRAKVFLLNYPNNPTGATASRTFFSRVVELAHQYGFVVLHDIAYGGLVFDGKPLSFLSVPGAMEVGLELHSASKNFNMTGWRCGFVVGNPRLIAAYGAVKEHTDSGQFLAIQAAVAWCLEHPEFTEALARKYSRRMDLLVGVLQRLGFPAQKSGGTFFLYTRAPRAVHTPQDHITFGSAQECAEWLIREPGVVTVPWDEAGPYLRWSVTFGGKTPDEEENIVQDLYRRLQSYTFEW